VLGGSAIFRYQFEQETEEKVNELFSSVSENETEIKTNDLNNIPVPVKNWLEDTGILEEPAINSARSLQRAEMRLEDQGTLVRFLAEIVWIPSAALSDYITWEEINLNSARATMSFGDITASGVFTFNDRGEPIGFTAERYRDVDGEFEMETWSISMDNYQMFDGIKVTAAGEITWELAEGDFTLYKFEIKEFEYNQPEVY
ncbi:MAG: DUF6544 family protein, partial [Bacillota bacterium]